MNQKKDLAFKRKSNMMDYREDTFSKLFPICPYLDV